MTTGLDRRLTPARPGFAAAHLRGVVEADRFVDGVPRRIGDALADVRAEPRPDCPIDTQALHGEAVDVYVEEEGYAFVRLAADGYVGWIADTALAPPGPPPTHRVAALRTLRFPGPDLRMPVVGPLPQGALVHVAGTVERRGLDYALLPDGTATVMRHLEPLDPPEVHDAVEIAEAYLGTPYLWGGRSSLGIDCSGLVQVSLAMAGVAAPRDSDMQEAALGAPVAVDDPAAWRRGDLVFWNGHVGIVRAPGRLLHATGHFMAVVDEPLPAALARIAAAGLPVTAVRRVGLSPGR